MKFPNGSGPRMQDYSIQMPIKTTSKTMLFLHCLKTETLFNKSRDITKAFKQSI